MIPCRSLALPFPTHVWESCAHRWLIQPAPHGFSHEFKGYWDSLGKERQQKYDAEATKLVSGYSLVPLFLRAFSSF
ncbi:hypothetical protein M405DRAFT_816675 [Rhizopogon salebrosus TDB-379]|nr:hypothetical protein M405DRAFT_816675 [Rhizopogon salebrosus TDB-379]